MRAAEVAFVGCLVCRLPNLMPLLQEHLDDYETLLPHVLLGDVTRWVVERARPSVGPEVETLLAFFETSFVEMGEHERELISVSFLENLPPRGEAGSELRDQLGPNLTQQLRQIG